MKQLEIGKELISAARMEAKKFLLFRGVCCLMKSGKMRFAMRE